MTLCSFFQFFYSIDMNSFETRFAHIIVTSRHRRRCRHRFVHTFWSILFTQVRRRRHVKMVFGLVFWTVQVNSLFYIACVIRIIIIATQKKTTFLVHELVTILYYTFSKQWQKIIPREWNTEFIWCSLGIKNFHPSCLFFATTFHLKDPR